MSTAANPPAFPTMEHVHDCWNTHAGMTLRDWFAGQALASGAARQTAPDYELKTMFGANRTGIRSEEIMAADAYRIADAMLAAREAPKDSATAKPAGQSKEWFCEHGIDPFDCETCKPF